MAGSGPVGANQESSSANQFGIDLGERAVFFFPVNIKAEVAGLITGLPLKQDLAFILRGGKGVKEDSRGGAPNRCLCSDTVKT